MFFLVILAAFLHAVWNALIKGSDDKYLAMLCVAIGHLPLALIVLPFAVLPDPAAIPWLIASLLFHLGYQLFLVQGYRVGDLTQVYPIARGLGPLLVLIVSLFALGVSLSPLQVVSILMIATGIFLLVFLRQGQGGYNKDAVAMALITGVFIASYSLVDGLGARIAQSALGFWCLSAIGNAVVLALWTRVTRPGILRSLPQNRRAMRFGLLGGSASFVAYGIAVWAFTQAPIALVTALRETSIIFALVIGIVMMGERITAQKIVATVFTLGGVIAMRLA